MNSQVVSAPADQWIACARCGAEFAFTIGEQSYYAQKKISPPRNCRACREKRKAEDAERLAATEQALAGAVRETGTVQLYDPERGYGFIEDEPPLFFHCSALRVNRNRIQAGVRVQFYRIASARQPGKFCAEHVTLAEENGAKP
jgi:cold shock CspA family protein